MRLQKLNDVGYFEGAEILNREERFASHCLIKEPKRLLAADQQEQDELY
jgi:hypothetical protein